MYETFLGFQSRPFASTANAEQPLFGQSMQKAMSNARQCIERGSGPALIIGAPGVGKSLLLTALGQQYRDQFHIINLSCSRVDGRQEFLQTALFELRQPYRGFSEGELRLSLLDFLRTDQEKPNGILLLIDDGENLAVEVLDEIRVVSNFVQDGQPRTRLVLAGGYRLEEQLNDSRLHSLNQRIAARCFLRNMGHAECDEFIRDQIRRAGGDGQLFSDESLQSIFELTEGCPRFVNQLCDHVLILCATYGRKQIDADMVNEAWSDLQCFPDAFAGGKGSSSFCQLSSELPGEQGKWSIVEFGSLDEACLSEPSPDSETCSEFRQSQRLASGPVAEPGLERDEWISCDTSAELPTVNRQDFNFSQFHSDESVPEAWGASVDDAEDFQSFTTELDGGWKSSANQNYNPYESQTDWGQTSESDEAEQPPTHWSVQDHVQATPVVEQHEPEIEHFAANPFEEVFDEVEVVTSRFAAQIAQRNRASQDLTPGDLSCLNAIAEYSDSPDQSNLSVASDCCDGTEHCRHQIDVTIVEKDCRAEDPHEAVAGEQGEQYQLCMQSSSQPFQAAEKALSPTEQEADALLQQLSNAFGEPIDHFNSTIQVSHENPAEDHAYTLRLPSDETHRTVESDPSLARSHDAEIHELNSLKQAIEEQNRFSAQAFDRLIFQTNSQASKEGWQIQPASMPAEQTPESSAAARPADDREILICQPADNVSSEPSSSSQQLPFPPTPVSTGRAERMDYQQLFNQLRNLPDT